jgi:hypothetical protein
MSAAPPVVSRSIVLQNCANKIVLKKEEGPEGKKKWVDIPENEQIRLCAFKSPEGQTNPISKTIDISENVVVEVGDLGGKTDLALFKHISNALRSNTATPAATKALINTWLSTYEFDVPKFKLGQECVIYEEHPDTKRLRCLGLIYGAGPPATYTMNAPSYDSETARARWFFFPRAFPFKVKMGNSTAAIDADEGRDIYLPARRNILDPSIFELLPPFTEGLQTTPRVGVFVTVTVEYPDTAPPPAPAPALPPKMTATAQFVSKDKDEFSWKFGTTPDRKDPNPDLNPPFVVKENKDKDKRVADYYNSLPDGTDLPIIRVLVKDSCDDPTQAPPEAKAEEEDSTGKIITVVVIGIVCAIFIGLYALYISKRK